MDTIDLQAAPKNMHEVITLLKINGFDLRGKSDSLINFAQNEKQTNSQIFKRAISCLWEKPDEKKLKLAKEYLEDTIRSLPLDSELKSTHHQEAQAPIARAAAPAPKSSPPRPSQQAADPRSAQAQTEAEDDGAGEDAAGSGRDYKSIHMYSKVAAVCFSADMTRNDEATVRIEAANSSGVRQYDWADKIIIQLTTKELPMVLAVMMGVMDRIENKAHGQANDKGFKLENQQGKIYCSVFAAGKSMRSAPIYAPDVYPICDLILRQMLKNSPHLNVETILGLMHRSVFVQNGNGKSA